MTNKLNIWRTRLRTLALCANAVWSSNAIAGNGANFVLYNQHTEGKGETEIELYSDFSNVGGDDKNYAAQLLEIEYGVTDLWTTSLYLEGVKMNGDDYDFGSFRFENRVRLFRQSSFLNPVLYAEYEQKQPESRYIRSVVGRLDDEAGDEEETEHELETKLILGHDVSDRLNVAFNWINELKFDNGVWAFGYAAGLNYVLFRSADEDEGQERDGKDIAVNRWDLEKVTLGVELYGGLGDSVLGLTADADKTQQYAGINLQSEFENHVHVGLGGAFGLTSQSENALLRLNAGYEFE
jgi:hypothetical protein